MKWICPVAMSLAATWCGFADRPAESLDPIFATIPFDRWSEKDPGVHFRWSTHVSSPALSQHQRLMIEIKIQVDGVELVKRQGQGTMQLLIQLRDQAGGLFQNHNAISLEDVKPETSRSYSVYTQNALVLPGDYQVSLGWFVSAAGEHGVVRRTMHVDPFPRDPLPDAWRDLPSVAFMPDELAAGWYSSSTVGRVSLPVETKQPVRMELLVNGSRTEQLPAMQHPNTSRLTTSALLPPINVISQIRPTHGSLNIAVLDLERQRVAFEQTATRELDWTKLLGVFSGDNPNTIDVRSLEHRQQNAQFFLSEIRRRALTGGREGAEPLHVLIVLSGPMAFDKADLTPIQAVPDPNCRVFYIRYRSIAPLRPANPFFPATEPGRLAGRRGAHVSRDAVLQPSDDLFGLIKPLDPRLFDVATPEEFRKALGNIMREIAQLGSAVRQ